MSLTGKVALITGASKGIGASTAVRLAKEGASVIIAYLSDSAGAQKVVDQIGADKATAIKADVSKVDVVIDLVKQVVAKHGKIDVLILAAGKMAPNSLEATTEVKFDDEFALHVKGPYFLCQVLLYPFCSLVL